jgi:uncharacterized protein YidB (DUF937 family)
VGTGPNKTITPEELQQVLGSETVQHLAAKVGLSPQDLLAKLSAVLPKAVDQMTPAGTIPH